MDHETDKDGATGRPLHGKQDPQTGPTDINTDDLPVEMVSLDLLVSGTSPRLNGENSQHIKTLAQTEERLPPILVHRPTMHVIDGIHRMAAARMRGEDKISVRFVDVDDRAAFVLAVQSNIAHGLSLTLADRKTAASRILNLYPELSDRAIARITGLATATVGGVRRRSTVQDGHSNARVSQDGRVRPLNTSEGRKRASELVVQRPDAPLREIAKHAGISLSTAQDVRKRIMQGHDPVPQKLQEAPEKPGRVSGSTALRRTRGPRARQAASILDRLRRDPSLRSSEACQALLKLLSTSIIGIEEWPDLIQYIPPHGIVMMAEIAKEFSRIWGSYAEDLERHDGNHMGSS